MVCHVVFVNLENKLLSFFLEVDFGSQRGTCKNVEFTDSGANGRKSFDCLISHVRKLAFKEGILDMVRGRPGDPTAASSEGSG